ncbi:MAG: cation:proton antiporter [Oscillospiraceae bacterium]|nr:cation:proton antiporter [Oscillospiraceae bacterium]MBR2928793.1 cation:proton antiporter [Oscillospiraceae bacterium]MBR6677909.1 cation:proton antiporter [Oscillospiraceae bacterium]
MDYTYLLLLAIILLFTKLFGLVTEKIHMPQVVGALLAGIILGPSGFGVLESSDFLVKTAEIGVILIMFLAGIDTDLEEMKHTGLQAFIIAVMGVVVPMVLCGAVYFFFFEDQFTVYNLLKASFVGSVFSATSVGITVETLNEMGKLKSKTGTTLLSAALIDDILGIVVLSFLTGFSSGEGNPVLVLVKIGGFFLFTIVVGVVMMHFFRYVAQEHWHSRRVAVWALAFCLIMSYCAEEFFGVADITGAFFAGLIMCNVAKSRKFVAKKMAVVSYMLFSPVFFASVGMKTDLRVINGEILIFAVVLLLAAILSKIIGCSAAGRLTGMTTHESLVTGIGMVARGEVALMVAQKGINAGMINPAILPAVVLSVICCALLTPVLLELSISKGPDLA